MLSFLSQPVRADELKLRMDIHQAGSTANGNLSFYAFSFLTTTNPPITYHEVTSWNTNLPFRGGVGPGTGNYGVGYSSLDNLLYAFTNGPWKLVMNVGSPSEQTYYFWMSATNFTTNTFPVVQVISPTNGAVNITNTPSFAWIGEAADFLEADVRLSSSSQYFYNYASLPPTATNWNPGQTLRQGVFNFEVTYFNTNAPTVLTVTTPTNLLGQTPPGWSAVNQLSANDSAQFTVGVPDPSGTDHVLVAHYPWDSTNSDGSAAGADTTGHGNDIHFSGSFGSAGGVNATSDAKAGPLAMQFHNGDGNSGGPLGWTNPTPPRLLAALVGSFSVSCWIKTTQSGFGWNSAPAYYGAGIVAAHNDVQANDVIPLALTGGSIGFSTGGDSDDTVNSVNSVNDGNYHHVVVTRNQLTGQKIIYIDGLLDTFSSGTLNRLSDPQKLTLGALADAGNPDPSTGGYYNGYDGELDDLQIYNGVLSSNEVAQLFINPGSTIPDNQGFNQYLAGRYDFENTNAPGMDSSGNGNDAEVSVGGLQLDVPSTNAAAGSYARLYAGDSALVSTPGSSAFLNLSNALAGSFTVSAWVNTTTHTINSDSANAYFGMPILFSYAPYPYPAYTNSAVPLTITGSKAAFTVYDENGHAITIHSTTTVNDGNYHLLAVTRNQTNGLMSLFVDGHLEATATSSTQALQISWIQLAGSEVSSYQGLLDDIRIYSKDLAAGEIAILAGNGTSTLAAALGTTNLTWTTTGDTSWRVETTNTYTSSQSAAQSGSVTQQQTSTLSATVTGPGTLSFFWSSIANDPNGGFRYEFDIDGSYAKALAGNQGWIPDGPYQIGPGQHTLTWTTSANNDTDPTQTGFLDQVTFLPPDNRPVSAEITLDINRAQNLSFGEIYFAYPGLNWSVPAAIGNTTNSITSPSGKFSTHSHATGSDSSSLIFFSLDELINECTNGLWTLILNEGLANESQYQFKASVSGLNTNILAAVSVTTPTNGAINVPVNTPFRWQGPAGYASIFVADGGGASYLNDYLPGTATYWPTPPILSPGPNQFNVSYASNDFPGLTFSVPTNSATSQSLASWVTHVQLHSSATSAFVVSSLPAPVNLLNPQASGTNFQFSFRSQAGFTNAVLYRTNLTLGSWQTYSNILGDGTLKMIALPFSLFSPSAQGFIRVSTQ